MTKSGSRRMWLISSCLVCTALTWRYAAGLEGTEFSGGRISGPLLDMFDGGGVLFFAAAVVSFFYARVGAAIALAATVLQLPLYVYFIAPGPFRAVFRGEYSVPLRANFEWDRWSVAGILVLAATIY
ncbi:MAG TPA: hypothetical protein VGV35_02900, partial [Bryobacteraceae bacterium]|nr:hypothetical protein [Bryobacteraceae bacterium]